MSNDTVKKVIPYENPAALIGYYCGIFSLIPLIGLVLGPIAVILGVIGLVVASKKPGAHGTAHGVVALVAGGIGAGYHLLIILFVALYA